MLEMFLCCVFTAQKYLTYVSQASNKSVQHLCQVTNWKIPSYLPFKEPVKTAVSEIPGSDGITLKPHRQMVKKLYLDPQPPWFVHMPE